MHASDNERGGRPAIPFLFTAALLLFAGCGTSGGSDAAGAGGGGGGGGGAVGSSSASGSSSSASGAGGGPGAGLASKYPGDVGIEGDPDVIWVENFEHGSIAAVTARYEDHKSPASMALVPDVPPKSKGAASMRFTAGGGGPEATDLFKNLAPGYDELYVRYYAKYQGGVSFHHTGVWIGGYNPASNWPSPQAGKKPNGDDRFSVALEPMGGGPNPRMDFYNYWMQMRSWMETPSGSNAYYGNTLVHQKSLRVADDAWMCVELHVKLNPDPASGAGAQLGLWVNGESIAQFTDKAPLGYWVRDKFCPVDADGEECTDYPPAPGTEMIPLDLRYRSTTDLKLNAFWPQNYITQGSEGSVQYDDIVIAKSFVGCLH